MKKILLVFCGSILLATYCYSQAHETTIEYDKKKQKALVTEFPYSPEAVENAIIERMDKLGYKGREEKGIFNKDKGFRIYSEASVREISQKNFDYIIYIEQKSKKEKDASLIYLIINTKDGQNVIQAEDVLVVDKAKDFLNNLTPDVHAAHLELQIAAQAEVVTKAEKKLKSLQDDKTDLEKRILKLQDDMKKNENDQVETQKDIELQKKNLEDLKGKRKVDKT
jgi:hypothetical protein